MILKNSSYTINTPFDVIVMGDGHDSPSKSKRRFGWIGKYCKDNPAKFFVSIGDWMSLDSLSHHDSKGSSKDMKRPSFHQDIDSIDTALGEFNAEAPSHEEMERIITAGNHEYRAHRQADLFPKECGDYGLLVEQAFARFNFTYIPYGKYLFLNGVGLTHVPFTTEGKPYKGKHLELAVARDSKFPIIMGHTHRNRLHTEAKIGDNEHIQVYNVGTALPENMIEEYADCSTTGWTYGIHRFKLYRGRVLDHQFVSMRTLEDTYG